MAAGSKISTAASDRVLVIERIFDAPRAVVWQAWADPAQMVKWIGPRGFTADLPKFDPRPGGEIRMHMRGPDGRDHWQMGVFREIIANERIVRSLAWTDAEGNITRPETLLTITFEDYRGKTKLTLRQEIFESTSACEQHRDGWNSALDCLADFLAAA